MDVLDVVKTTTDIMVGEETIPAGTTGTVVHVYEHHPNAVEVEFAEPARVITVNILNLESA